MTKIKDFMDWESPGTALITGASSGIGAAFAHNLANQGFNLILVARRKERLEQLALELENKNSIKANVIVADLSILEDIERLYSYIIELESLDVLINNAGFATRWYFDMIPFDRQKDMIFVHNLAPSYFCRAAIPGMIKRGRGVIINLSSISAIVNLPQNVMYSATKAFIKIFTETLAMELDNTGVKLQCLCPGFTKTEFHEIGDFKGFNRSLIPENLWMSAEEVVKLSLEAVSNDEIIFIPGNANQEFIKLWNNPKLGARTRKNMIKAFKIPRE